MEEEIFSAKKKRGEERMLKELIICIIIIVTVVGLSVISQRYTEETSTSITMKLEDLKEDVLEEKENLGEDIDNIINDWEERFKILAFYIEHDELEKVKTELTDIKSNIEVKDYEDAVPNIDKCIYILEHIKDRFKLSISNVF